MSEYFRKYIKKEHYPVQPSNLRFKTSFKNCIYESLKRRTWKETDHESEWDIFWTEKEWIIEVMDHMHLAPHQKVNHFRNYYELCRKDNLIKNLKRYKKALEKEGKLDEAANFNFYPTTYNLPGEYSIFCEEFKRNSNHVWIMKPIGKSQGKGIFLFNKLSQVSQWKSETRWKPDAPQVDNYIVQRYINNPLLIGGKKFDMRIYCLVTSYSPLVAYLYRDGFARFTHHRYDSEDITNTYVHLTNVAIQKTSENYDEKLGGKWDLRTLKLYLMSKYGQEAVCECFSNIQQVIIRSLQSVQKVMLNDKHCFELYGFDVLLDDQLKPWLIEVNGSPSMTANTTHDFELKCDLLDDVFTIIDMEKILTGQEEQIGGFDLICKGTPIRAESSMFASMLSCHNNRAQQLKKLGKIISSKLAQAYLQEKEEAKRSITSKDNASISTAETGSSILGKGRSKALPGKVNNPIIGSKPTKPPMLNKQNTISYAKEPRESKEFKEATPSSMANNNSRLVKGRLSEVGKARTSLGLPPVNTNLAGNMTTNPNAPTMYAINNPSLLIPANTTPGGINNPNNMQKTSSNLSNNVSLSPLQNTAANSLSGKPILSQPSQQGQGDRFSQMISNKVPSTLQLAGGASLGFGVPQSQQTEHHRTKGRSITNIQDILDTKQNVYTYSTNRPSSKAEDRLQNNKAHDDIIDSIANKSRDNFRKAAGLLSESDALTAEEAMYLKRKDYPEELIQNSNYSDRDNYE